MNVLLLIEDAATCNFFTQVLHSADYRVVDLLNQDGSNSSLSDRALSHRGRGASEPNLVLLDVACLRLFSHAEEREDLPTLGGLSIREVADYLVLNGSGLSDQAILQSLEAGIDDLIFDPTNSNELVLRMAIAERWLDAARNKGDREVLFGTSRTREHQFHAQYGTQSTTSVPSAPLPQRSTEDRSPHDGPKYRGKHRFRTDYEMFVQSLQ